MGLLRTMTSTISSLVGAVARQQSQLAVEKESFAMTRSDAEDTNSMQGPCVCLDVGGMRFHTQRTVLLRQAPHYFSVLAADNFASQEEVDGLIFIDRDPDQFSVLLQYLRDGVMYEPIDVATSRSLQREARFYGMLPFSQLRMQPYVATFRQHWYGRVMQIYDPLLRLWRCLQVPAGYPAPRDRSYSVADTVWKNRLTIIIQRHRSLNERATTPILKALNPVLWAWEQICECPYWGKIVTVGADLYLFNGHEIAKYGADGAWESLPCPPKPVGCYTVCAAQECIYVLGGFDGLAPDLGEVRTVQRFSCLRRQWDILPDTNSYHINSGAVEWQGKLVVAGGDDFDDQWDTEIYDPTTAEWRDMAPLKYIHIQPMLMVCGGRLMAFGRGFLDADDDSSDDMDIGELPHIFIAEQYSERDNAWTLIDTWDDFETIAVVNLTAKCVAERVI